MQSVQVHPGHSSLAQRRFEKSKRKESKIISSKFEDTHDILSRKGYGKHGQLNTPTLKNMVEIDQEISELSAYISIDSGTTWHSVSRLTAISFCCKVDNIKLAFANNGTSKIYLAHYSVMF